MNVLAYLIPVSLILGGIGLVAFVFTVKARQYEDPDGAAQRILSDDYDDHPKSSDVGP